MKKRNIVNIVLAVLAVIFAILAMNGYLKERREAAAYDKLRQDVAATKEVEEPEEPVSSVVPEESASAASAVEEPEEEDPELALLDDASDEYNKVDIPIDFETLWETAPDAYAWITIPDTNIDYPIMHHPDGDNLFYLTHSPDGTPAFAGSIYTESYNTTTFDDPNTLIYGHNLASGLMFTQLHKFEDRTFFEEHPYFTIYTTDKILTYRVFAAYNYDDRHIMLSFDFDDRAVFSRYIDSIFEQRAMSANIDRSVEVTADDKIVTLSTCNAVENQRYLVQGVLLSNTEERSTNQ